MNDAPGHVEHTLGTPGRPLESAVRDFMELRFHHDFSRVRVHTDGAAAESARALHARAYSFGAHVVFASNQYQPAVPWGRRLIAHELAHVVQQSATGTPLVAKLSLGRSDDPEEAEADRVADRVVVGEATGALTASAPVLRRDEVAGCRVDGMSERAIGVAAHRVIQGWCATQNAPCIPELPIEGSGPSGGMGEADMVGHQLPLSSEIEIGEIKPISQRTFVDPHLQLARYILAFQALNPSLRVVPMYSWTPGPPNGMYPFFSTPSRLQFLNCGPPAAGVYFYWCTSARKPERWVPVPVEVPEEVWQRVRDALRRMREQARESSEPAPQPEGIPKWVWAVIAVASAIAVIALAISMLPVEILAGLAALVGLALGIITLGEGTASAATGGSGSRGASGGTGTGGTGTGAGAGGTTSGTSIDSAVSQLERVATSGAGGSAEQARQAVQAASGSMDAVARAAAGDQRSSELRAAAAATAPRAAAASARLGARGGSPGSRPSAAPSTVPGGGPRRDPAATGGGGQLRSAGGSAPEVLTPTTEVPTEGTRTSFPIWILSGVGPGVAIGSVHLASVRIDVDPPFIVPVLLRVISRSGNELTFEVARAWYVPERTIGSPVGARYQFRFPSR